MNVMLFYGFVFLGFILVYFLSHLCFKLLIRYNYIDNILHPYTKKSDKELFYDICRLFILFIICIYLIFKAYMYGLFAMLIFLFYGHLFLKTRNEKRLDATIITEWHYEEEDMLEWEEAFSKIDNHVSNKTKVTSKVVFTPKYAYLTKRKKISIKKEKFSNITLKNAEIQNGFLVLHYYFSETLKVKSFYIYIPKKIKRKDVVSLQKKIKDLIY